VLFDGCYYSRADIAVEDEDHMDFEQKLVGMDIALVPCDTFENVGDVVVAERLVKTKVVLK
jgi:hypothetical protein